MEFCPGLASTVQTNASALSDGATSSAATQALGQSNTGLGARGVTVTVSDAQGSLGSLPPQAQVTLTISSRNRRAVIVDLPR